MNMLVYYRPEQTATNRQCLYSPSAGKPARAVADWLRKGLITPD